jgi:hypothetical protein
VSKAKVAVITPVNLDAELDLWRLLAAAIKI